MKHIHLSSSSLGRRYTSACTRMELEAIFRYLPYLSFRANGMSATGHFDLQMRYDVLQIYDDFLCQWGAMHAANTHTQGRFKARANWARAQGLVSFSPFSLNRIII
ncbi:hypothetical protein TNCV_3174191 [Trichonephila clavipes]|nr:hypothetical protein TNCV_3174191 [Trichonephila clavipes]